MKRTLRAVRKIILGAVMLAISVAVRAQDLPKAQIAFNRGHDATGIPFELAGNHIYLRARLNDGPPLWFLFDSGAAENAILIAPESAPSELTGVRIALPGVAVSGLALAKQPLGFAAADGHTMDGVLTYGFIKNFVVDIDYAARRIGFHDPKTFHYAGRGERIKLTPLEADNGARIYLMDLGLTSRDGKTAPGHFIVDTGVRLALTVNTPFVERHGLLASERHTVEAVIGSGLSVTDTTLTMGRMAAITFGHISVPDVVTGFSQYREGVLALSEFDGILGGDFLRRFRVILDYSRDEIILEKNAYFAEPFEFDMSGALLFAEGQHFDAITVHATVAHSPAEAAGLVPGDRIVAIDGRPAAALGLQDIQQLFRHPGVRHDLTIARDGREIRTSITLRRLI